MKEAKRVSGEKEECNSGCEGKRATSKGWYHTLVPIARRVSQKKLKKAARSGEKSAHLISHQG